MMRKTLLVVVASLTSACVTNQEVPVEGRDDGAFASSLRFEIPFADAQPTEGADNPAGEAFEFSYTRAEGTDTQTLASGEHIDLGGVNFNGPTTIESELDLAAFTLAYRYTPNPERRVRLSLLGGMGILDAEAVVRAPGLEGTAKTSDQYKFPVYGWAGLELSGQLAERVRAWARFELPVIGESDLRQVEVGAELRIGSVALFGGWHWMEVEWARSGSNVNYELSGPMVGLRVRF